VLNTRGQNALERHDPRTLTRSRRLHQAIRTASHEDIDYGRLQSNPIPPGIFDDITCVLRFGNLGTCVATSRGQAEKLHLDLNDDNAIYTSIMVLDNAISPKPLLFPSHETGETKTRMKTYPSRHIRNWSAASCGLLAAPGPTQPLPLHSSHAAPLSPSSPTWIQLCGSSRTSYRAVLMASSSAEASTSLSRPTSIPTGQVARTPAALRTSYVSFFLGSPINWTSKRQATVSSSSMEAEYVAAAEETKDVIWLRSLLEELGLKQTTATTVHIDNQSPINLSANPSIHARTKHINIKHHLVREQVGFGTIRLEYIETAKQRADILTKALAGPKHATNALSLRVVPSKATYHCQGSDSESKGTPMALTTHSMAMKG
jgi:hypothetical protein